MHEQHRQQRPLLGPTECYRSISFDHLKRPQDSKLDHVYAPPSTLPPVPNPSMPGLTGVGLPTVDQASTASRPAELMVLAIGSHTATDNPRRQSA